MSRWDYALHCLAALGWRGPAEAALLVLTCTCFFFLAIAAGV